METIMLDTAGDLLLQVYDAADKSKATKAVYQVSVQILKESSDYFRTTLSEQWKSNSGTESLGVDHHKAFGLWLQILHNNVQENTHDIAIKEIWHAVQVSRQFLLPTELLCPWFSEWLCSKGTGYLETCPFADLQCVLYLCHELEHPEGFHTVTRRLVYESQGHVKEMNPTKYRHLHTPERILMALNAARGSIRRQLHERVYHNNRFLTSNCSCRKDGLFAYELALLQTGVWPLETMFSGKPALQKSLHEVLEGFESFSYDAPNTTCSVCFRNYDTLVAVAVRDVQVNFGGLCLDCGDDKKERDWDLDNDYNYHGVPPRDRHYDLPCRIDHGQPSWYFSGMMRKHRPDAHEKEREDRFYKRKLNYGSSARKRKFDDASTGWDETVAENAASKRASH